MKKIAIIGTAGRDKNPLLTLDLWESMKADLYTRVSPTDTVISGGAAWADHLAIYAYLSGWCQSLELKLPAPLVKDKFLGEFKSAGSASNHYHHIFGDIIKEDTIIQITHAIRMGAAFDFEPMLTGISGMFIRNAKVAKACTSIIAYTFGDGNVPADGGTKDTWNKAKTTDRIHIDLKTLGKHYEQI
jgi:hypothetical protein